MQYLVRVRECLCSPVPTVSTWRRKQNGVNEMIISSIGLTHFVEGKTGKHKTMFVQNFLIKLCQKEFFSRASTR